MLHYISVSQHASDIVAHPVAFSLLEQERSAKLRVECEAWKDKHKLVRSKLGVSPTYKPWTERKSGPPGLLGVPADNPRYLDCLDLAWSSRKAKCRSLPFYCDYSQCPTRSPWGESIRTFTTSSRSYDFQRERVVSPVEGLALHGVPVHSFDWTMFKSESMFFTALGESMSCPCVGSILLSVYLNRSAPWWRRGSASSDGTAS
jgi:hypothetical protein